MSVRVTNDRVSRAAAERVLRPLIVEAGGVKPFASQASAAGARTAAYYERTLNRIMGAPQTTHRRRKQVQGTVSAVLLDELLAAVGCADLWHGPELRRWGQARECGAYGTQPRRYSKQRAESKMTLAEIRQAHGRYLEGESLRALGRALWEEYGYASPTSCANSLSEAFLREGLPTRDRIEATKLASTVHGNAGRADRQTLRYRVHRKRQRREAGEVRGVKCAGLVQVAGAREPRPCRNFALDGKLYCLGHDPDRRPEVLATVNKLRGLRGLPLVSDAVAA